MNSNKTTGCKVYGTLTSPNVRKVIYAVSLILQQQIQEHLEKKKKILKDSEVFFFSEEKYMIEKSEEFDDSRKALLRAVPSVENIIEFVQAIYDLTKFSPQCFVISLVYINRFITFSSSPFLPENWRPIVLIALLIAQKLYLDFILADQVWDDINFSNSYFAEIYPFFTNEEVNKLEEKFLEFINYKLVINGALYAKYYFELSTLFPNDDIPFDRLDAEEARRLESKSEEVEQMTVSLKKFHTIH